MIILIILIVIVLNIVIVITRKAGASAEKRPLTCARSSATSAERGLDTVDSRPLASSGAIASTSRGKRLRTRNQHLSQKSSWISSGISQWIFSGIFKRDFTFHLHIPTECHSSDFWCVIISPEPPPPPRSRAGPSVGVATPGRAGLPPSRPEPRPSAAPAWGRRRARPGPGCQAGCQPGARRAMGCGAGCPPFGAAVPACRRRASLIFESERVGHL